MGFWSELGPTLLALVTAIAIAVYGWNRARLVSVGVLVWVHAAVALSQFPLFAGFPDWHTSDARGFMIFGTLAFAPALLLLFALRLNPFAGALAQIPTSALLATQASRLGGLYLIAAYRRGELPAEIGLVSGVLDVAVAFTAVALALYLRGDETRAPRLVRPWAIPSLADFGWATLMMNGSHLGLLDLHPAPVMMGNPTLLIISLFALPLGIFVSMVVLLRVRRG